MGTVMGTENGIQVIYRFIILKKKMNLMKVCITMIKNKEKVFTDGKYLSRFIEGNLKMI